MYPIGSRLVALWVNILLSKRAVHSCSAMSVAAVKCQWVLGHILNYPMYHSMRYASMGLRRGLK